MIAAAQPGKRGSNVAALAVCCASLLAGAVAARQAVADDTAGAALSIWDGVFTAAQAERGQTAYTGPCSHCHGYRLNGAPDDPDMFSTPPLAGPKLLRDWDGRSLAALLEYTRTTMPENNPGYLSDQEYTDIVAYMLSVSGLPPGGAALRPDPSSLARIVIRRQP